MCVCARVCSCVVAVLNRLVTVSPHDKVAFEQRYEKIRELNKLEIISTQKEQLKCRC